MYWIVPQIVLVLPSLAVMTFERPKSANNATSPTFLSRIFSSFRSRYIMLRGHSYLMCVCGGSGWGLGGGPVQFLDAQHGTSSGLHNETYQLSCTKSSALEICRRYRPHTAEDSFFEFRTRSNMSPAWEEYGKDQYTSGTT